MKNINVVSKKFQEYIRKANVNSVIKFFSNKMEGDVRPLNKGTIDLLKAKHPLEKAASEETKLHGLLPIIKNMIFDIIVNSMVLETTKTTEEGCGSSRMGADGWRRILISRDYGDASNNLRKAKASRINKIDIEEINYLSLSTLMASRLVQLDKNLGLRPIGALYFSHI